MIACTQLAAMDHNFNLNRSQAVTYGEDQSLERYKVVFPKSHKDWVGKPIMESTLYDYVFQIMYDVIQEKIEEHKQSIDLPPHILKNTAPKPIPEKSIVINRHKSRFKKQKY